MFNSANDSGKRRRSPVGYAKYIWLPKRGDTDRIGEMNKAWIGMQDKAVSY